MRDRLDLDHLIRDLQVQECKCAMEYPKEPVGSPCVPLVWIHFDDWLVGPMQVARDWYTHHMRLDHFQNLPRVVHEILSECLGQVQALIPIVLEYVDPPADGSHMRRSSNKV